MKVRLNKTLDHLIYSEYRQPEGAMSLFRIVYSSFIIFIVGVPQFRWISDYPNYFYEPPKLSLAALFSGFPSFTFLLVIDILLVGLFVLLLFGFYTRVVSISIFLLLIIGHSFYYSFGKINHDTLLMTYVPLAMAFSNWGRHFSLDHQRLGSTRNSNERHWPILLLAILLGFGMFSAGVSKLVGGWLDPTVQTVKNFVITLHYYDNFPERFIQPYLIGYDNWLFWEAMDFTAVIFEIGFLLAVIKQKLFRIFIIIAITFHTINVLIFSISFVNNLALYLLFIDWDKILAKFVTLRLNRFVKLSFLLPVLVVVLVGYIINFPVNFMALANAVGVHFLTSSLIICGLAVVLFSVNYLKSWSD